MSEGNGELIDFTTMAAAELLPPCEHSPEDTKYFEYKMSPDGQVLCKWYPYSGMYQSMETKRVYANEGGRKDWNGTEMAETRHANRREAIIKGLTDAALERGVGIVPEDMLSDIIKNQAQMATEQTRDGTGAAKFVFGLVGYLEEADGSKGAAITIEMDQATAAKVIDNLIGGDDE